MAASTTFNGKFALPSTLLCCPVSQHTTKKLLLAALTCIFLVTPLPPQTSLFFAGCRGVESRSVAARCGTPRLPALPLSAAQCECQLADLRFAAPWLRPTPSHPFRRAMAGGSVPPRGQSSPRQSGRCPLFAGRVHGAAGVARNLYFPSPDARGGAGPRESSPCSDAARGGRKVLHHPLRPARPTPFTIGR